MRTVSGLEIFLAATVAIWGVWLVGSDTFSGPGAAAFAPMAAVAPENVWAAFCLLLGFGQLLGVALYVRFGQRVFYARLIALALDAAFYGFIGTMFASVSLNLVGVGIWGLFFFACFGVFWGVTRRE